MLSRLPLSQRIDLLSLQHVSTTVSFRGGQSGTRARPVSSWPYNRSLTGVDPRATSAHGAHRFEELPALLPRDKRKQQSPTPLRAPKTQKQVAKRAPFGLQRGQAGSERSGARSTKFGEKEKWLPSIERKGAGSRLHADSRREKRSPEVQDPMSVSTGEVRHQIRHSPAEPRKHANGQANRQAFLDHLQTLIQETYGKPYTVELFGSAVYGLDGKKSDLDVIILDPDRPRGFPPGVTETSLPAVYDVKNLSRTLRKDGFVVSDCRPWASVPIVKFRDPVRGLECDLSVNERMGLYNSAMIKHYCDLSPILRPVLRVIKLWAESYKYIDPSLNKFSSYALTLMTIGLFQTWKLLPNLQRTPLPPTNPDGATSWWISRDQKAVECDVRYHVMPEWKPPVEMTVQQALAKWFWHWSIAHNYEEDAIAIRLGGLCNRTKMLQQDASAFSHGRPLNGTLCVMDPFIIDKNTTCQLKAAFITGFRHVCEVARLRINSKGDILDVEGRRLYSPRHSQKSFKTRGPDSYTT